MPTLIASVLQFAYAGIMDWESTPVFVLSIIFGVLRAFLPLSAIVYFSSYHHKRKLLKSPMQQLEAMGQERAEPV